MATQSISINPLTFSGRKLFVDGSNKPNTQEFAKLLNDLGQWANQIQQILTGPSILASVLNGSAQVLTSAAKKTFFNPVYTVTTNPTIECIGSCFVGIYIILGTGGATTAGTAVTLAHLDDGVPVQITIWNNQTGANTYSINASTPSGTLRNNTSLGFPSSVAGSAVTNISTVAQTLNAGNFIQLFGMASNGILWVVA